MPIKIQRNNAGGLLKPSPAILTSWGGEFKDYLKGVSALFLLLLGGRPRARVFRPSCRAYRQKRGPRPRGYTVPAGSPCQVQFWPAILKARDLRRAGSCSLRRCAVF